MFQTIPLGNLVASPRMSASLGRPALEPKLENFRISRKLREGAMS